MCLCSKNAFLLQSKKTAGQHSFFTNSYLMTNGGYLFPLKFLNMRKGLTSYQGALFIQVLSFKHPLLHGTMHLSVGAHYICHCVGVAGLRTGRGYLGERIGAWEGQRGLSFLQNMELRAGELLVPHAGLYYIYAQTYFRLSSAGETEGEANGNTVEEDGAQLVQYIYKKVWLCSVFSATFLQRPVLFEKVLTLFSYR